MLAKLDFDVTLDESSHPQDKSPVLEASCKVRWQGSIAQVKQAFTLNQHLVSPFQIEGLDM